MEDTHNYPNSPERFKRVTLKTWSNLPLDLLISVFQRLSFVNYQRAKTVCSSWLSASRQCVPKKTLPWMILFPKDNNDSCMLLNPEEKDKLYKTQDLGLGFNKSVCKATYGSYLLTQDPNLNGLYIVNLFTRERINLPCDSRTINPQHALFWVDEKTKDYIVVISLRKCLALYTKKGDTSWNQIPKTSLCKCMVYKDHKLCFLDIVGDFRIFDFSRDTPQLTYETGVRVQPFHNRGKSLILQTKLVMTVTGQVLKVDMMLRPKSEILTFRVFKVYSPPGGEPVERNKLVHSLGHDDGGGDEAMLFDQGITVLANDVDGMVRNSIYFTYKNYDLIVFDLLTHKYEILHKFDSSNLVRFSGPRWFLPWPA
ncbi:unnamed protein product [Cochlearia groenlandica]